MKQIKTLILEDEAPAAEMLGNLLKEYCKNVSVEGYAFSLAEATSLIEKIKPDLIISDIVFPDGTAFDMLSRMKKIDFYIIFLTAYSEYAIKAFKISAIDYLLKPIDIDLLTAAIEKVEKEIEHQNFEKRIHAFLSNLFTQNIQARKIVLNAGKTMHIVYLSDIIFCMADGQYTHFFLTSGEVITVSRLMKEVEELLTGYGFFRTNRQFIINLKHVVSYEKNFSTGIRMINGTEIPIAVRRRDLFLDLLQQW